MNRKDFYASLIAGILIGGFAMLVANSLFSSRLDGWLLAGVWFAGLGLVSLFAGIGKFVGKRIPAVHQIVKFVIVGGLNTLVDFGILNLLIAVFSETTGTWYAIFKGISFVAAVFNSYWWNKYWTFESREHTDANKLLRFFTVSVVGFGVNVIIASVIVNLVSPLFGLSDVLWANVGAVVATAASMVWNFIGYKFFVFHVKRPGDLFASKEQV